MNQIIYIYGDKCTGCNVIKKTIDELFLKYGNQIDCKKMNSNENSTLIFAKKNNVFTVPTMLFLKDGVEVDRLAGVDRKVNIEQKFLNLLSNEKKT